MTSSTLLHAAAMLAFVGAAEAALTITPLGTDAPPTSFIPPGSAQSFPLIPAIDDTTPILDIVTSVAFAPEKHVLFSIPMQHRAIGEGWATWSHGYTGDVYYAMGAPSVTMTFDQADMQAFYFYVEPGPFGLWDFTISATSDDGHSASIDATIEGFAGAQGFLIATDGVRKLSAITVTPASADFSIGEFGWSKTVPAPGALALLAVAGFSRRCRCR